MAVDGEDGNGLRYGFFKKRQDVSFDVSFHVWLENRLNFAKTLLQCGLSSRHCFNHLVRAIKFLLHKFWDNFANL